MELWQCIFIIISLGWDFLCKKIAISWYGSSCGVDRYNTDFYNIRLMVLRFLDLNDWLAMINLMSEPDYYYYYYYFTDWLLDFRCIITTELDIMRWFYWFLHTQNRITCKISNLEADCCARKNILGFLTKDISYFPVEPKDCSPLTVSSRVDLTITSGRTNFSIISCATLSPCLITRSNSLWLNNTILTGPL